MMNVSEIEGGGPGAPPAAAEGAPAKPDTSYIVGAWVAVIVAAIVAILLASKNDVTIGVGEGFAPFAVIYLVAQAIERGLQPFTYLVGKADEKSVAKRELRDAKSAHSLAMAMNQEQAAPTAAVAVAKQRNLDVIVADRAVLFWAIATVVSLLACGLLELGLIESIAQVSGKSGEVPSWFQYADVVITGIAIGSGTKPLHDLIAFIQNTKQKADLGAGPA